MKRDLDLARKILQRIEDKPYRHYDHAPMDIPGTSDLEAQYQLLLLKDAGLIVAIDASTHDNLAVRPSRLTWDGHEFVEASRNETMWMKAKSIVVGKTGGLAFGITLNVLKELAWQSVKDTMGIKTEQAP